MLSGIGYNLLGAEIRHEIKHARQRMGERV